MKYKFEKPIHGSIGYEKYQCTVEWRNGKFIADEPIALGGQDSGPDPYTLLLSSLATCTLVTMRMYIDRQGWAVPQIALNVNLYQEAKDGTTKTIIDQDIIFLSELEDEKKNSLAGNRKKMPYFKNSGRRN